MATARTHTPVPQIAVTLELDPQEAEDLFTFTNNLSTFFSDQSAGRKSLGRIGTALHDARVGDYSNYEERMARFNK